MKCKRCGWDIGSEGHYASLNDLMLAHYEAHIWEINMVDGIKQDLDKSVKKVLPKETSK